MFLINKENIAMWMKIILETNTQILNDGLQKELLKYKLTVLNHLGTTWNIAMADKKWFRIWARTL